PTSTSLSAAAGTAAFSSFGLSSFSGYEPEFWTLAEKLPGVLKNQFVDRLLAVASLAHFERGFGHCQRIAHSPVASAIHPEALVAIDFNHIDGARRRALGFRIKCHAGPHARIQHELDGVLLDVIDDDALRLDS